MDNEMVGRSAMPETDQGTWIEEPAVADTPFVARRAIEIGRDIRSHIRPLRGGLRDLPGFAARAAAELRWTRRIAGTAHALPKPLIVSLTSYPPRFATLALSLKCLLSQSVAADQVILWLANDDFAQLPADVLDLRRSGLEIERTRDIRSFKKIIPALRHHPDAFIVTADDDVYYPSSWLSELVAGVGPNCQEIPAGRVHRIVLDGRGAPAPYIKWALDIKEGPASSLHMATGVGGVLYPPGSLHPDVLDERLSLRLCASNDDLWLYFMERRCGSRVRKVGPRRPYISWAGSQRVALQHANVLLGGGNDKHLARLIEYFGSPFEGADPCALELERSHLSGASPSCPPLATPTHP